MMELGDSQRDFGAKINKLFSVYLCEPSVCLCVKLFIQTLPKGMTQSYKEWR